VTQTTNRATLTSHVIVVEDVGISSERSFGEVCRRLEDTLPKFDASIAEVRRSRDRKRAKDYEESGPKLSIFEERDHGTCVLRTRSPHYACRLVIQTVS
jgi:hypothetical protein